jgi:hypothetical protein
MDLYNAVLALHLEVLLFLLYDDDMVPFWLLSFPYHYLQTYTTNWEDLEEGGGRGEEPKGPFLKIAHQTLRTVRGF